jgi:hypothetical protein
MKPRSVAATLLSGTVATFSWPEPLCLTTAPRASSSNKSFPMQFDDACLLNQVLAPASDWATPFSRLNPITVFNVRAAVTVSQFAYDHVLSLYDSPH